MIILKRSLDRLRFNIIILVSEILVILSIIVVYCSIYFNKPKVLPIIKRCMDEYKNGGANI